VWKNEAGLTAQAKGRSPLARAANIDEMSQQIKTQGVRVFNFILQHTGGQIMKQLVESRHVASYLLLQISHLRLLFPKQMNLMSDFPFLFFFLFLFFAAATVRVLKTKGAARH
jgi:hypothetical protein